MIACRRPVPLMLALVLSAQLSGCGAVIVTRTVTGAGSLLVDGAVGAVNVTGKAVSATTGAVVGLARGPDDAAQ